MLVCVSPAKSLDWSERDGLATTQPNFSAQAHDLAQTARQLSQTDLKQLMHISDDLARLNRDRFQAFQDNPPAEITRPAALAFNGDTYQGLQAETFNDDDMAWAQNHLCILSGLYGLLRPLDSIQPYRLEMGSRLKTEKGANLYAYWDDTIAQALNAQAMAVDADTLVNCASQEYFKAVKPKALTLRVVTPQFLEIKDGTAKTISFFAKRARGAMARFMVQHRVTQMDDLLDFDLGGYAYDATLSKLDNPAFVRDYPAK